MCRENQSAGRISQERGLFWFGFGSRLSSQFAPKKRIKKHKSAGLLVITPRPVNDV